MAVDREIPTILVGLVPQGGFPGLLQQQRGIQATFNPLHKEALVYTVPRKGSSGSMYPQDQQIHSVRWQTGISDSLVAFLQGTLRVYRQSELNGKVQGVKQASVEYQQCIYNHTTLLEQQQQGEEAVLFAAMHSVWHLSHILYFEGRNAKLIVMEDLVGWLMMNHSRHIQTEFERIMKMVSPTQHEAYWPFVTQCVLRGHFTAAIAVLRLLDSSSSCSAIESLAVLLQAMPMPSAVASQSLFLQQWQRWHQDALLLKATEDYQPTQTLLSIVCGSEETIINQSSSWQEALVALVLFAHPQSTAMSLSELVPVLTDRFASATALDLCLLALLDHDLGKALLHASQLDWWLVTHLVDLFAKIDALEAQEAGELAEWYRLMYADYLTSHESLWRVSLEYLLHCPTHGRAMLQTLIPRLALTGSRKTHKLLVFCDKHSLLDVKLQLHRVVACKAVDSRRFGEAIWHYLQAEEGAKVAAICSRLLSDYTQHGDETFNTVVDALNPDLLFRSERLTFVTRYREFQRLYANGAYSEAGRLLVQLLSSQVTPRVFWKPMLLDALPMLEGELLVFSTQDTFELMRCLEEAACSESEGEKLNVLRLALTRNLSRSLF